MALTATEALSDIYSRAQELLSRVERFGYWDLVRSDLASERSPVPPGWIDQAIAAAQCWLVLKALGYKGEMPSWYVDEAMRCTVAYTRRYRVLCQKVIGRMLDYEPMREVSPDSQEQLQEAYWRAFAGQLPVIWRMDAHRETSGGDTTNKSTQPTSRET